MNLKNKADVSRLFQLGAFGNKLRTWEDYHDIPPECHGLQFYIRSLEPQGMMKAFLSYDELRCLQDELQLIGEWNHYIGENITHDDLVFNAEIMRVTGGLYLQYSREKVTLREAFTNPLLNKNIICLCPIQIKNFLTISTFTIKNVLQHWLTPYSYIELMECLDLSPDAIVEFSVFNRDIGERPGRNTIIWEVREY